jgi:hypothetical protein
MMSQAMPICQKFGLILEAIVVAAITTHTDAGILCKRAARCNRVLTQESSDG